jgi:RimJ/RimL family protein N-acetyltransferase
MSVIYGERVRLRAAERADVEKFCVWVNDPEVTRYLSLYLPMSRVDEENWFEAMTKRDQREKTLVIEVRDGDGWKMIGNCGVFDIDLGSCLAKRMNGTRAMAQRQWFCYCGIASTH